jgi:hypothetical protein
MCCWCDLLSHRSAEKIPGAEISEVAGQSYNRQFYVGYCFSFKMKRSQRAGAVFQLKDNVPRPVRYWKEIFWYSICWFHVLQGIRTPLICMCWSTWWWDIDIFSRVIFKPDLQPQMLRYGTGDLSIDTLGKIHLSIVRYTRVNRH